MTAVALESGLLEGLPAFAGVSPDPRLGPAQDGATASAGEPAPAPEQEKLRFEFYSLLPEAEVVVTERELARQREKNKPAPTPSKPADEQLAPVVTASPSSLQPADTTVAASAPIDATNTQSTPTGATYMLQVGSFRKNAQAEQLRARLALLGLQARIEKVTVDGKNGQSTWHRVRLGPFGDVDQLDQARGLLGKDGVQSLVIKARG